MTARNPATDPEVAFDPESWEPVVIGPTWQRDETGAAYVMPEYTLGWELAEFCAKWLHINDPLTGELEPFVFTPEQLRFALWFYAHDEQGRFLYQRSLLQRAKGWGKDPFAAALAIFEAIGPCRLDYIDEDGESVGRRLHDPYIQIAAVSLEQPLALDTRVNTPSGWTTLGELTVGDFVFDEHGVAQEVKRETEVMHDHRVFDLTFDDGQTVRASENHGWTVNVNDLHTSRVAQRTMTTGEIAAFLASGDRRSVSVDVAPVDYPEAELLLDPYMLGYWLGDGNSRNAGICVGREDFDHLRDQLEAIADETEHVTETGSFERSGAKCLSIVKLKKPGNGRIESVYQKLRHEQLIGNKHIPANYLRSSEAQRRALLQGMVDSDGHCVDGRVQFTNKNPRLIEGFVELARSLGYKPKVYKAFGGAQYAAFINHDKSIVARIPRKQAGAVDFELTRSGAKRYVRSVIEVASEPVKCIGIDTESHLFQVEGGILTHNTRNTADMFRSLLTPEAQDEFKANLGLEVQYFRDGLSQIHCVTSNPGPLEGKRPTFIVCNETQEWVAATKGPEMYGKLKGNLIKRPLREQCHMLIIANAPVPGRGSVSESLIEAYENTLAGKADDRDLLYDSLEAPSNVPVDRETIPAVIEKIRGDSIWIDPDTVVGDFFDSLIPLSESRRKWFNQRTADSDSIYSRAQIAAAHREAMLRPGDEIVLGFDGGRTNDATALVAIRIKDRVIIPIRVWEKPREVEDWVVPHDQVESAIHDTFSRYKVRAFFADVNLWESFILSWSADYGEQLAVRASGESAIGWDMRGVRKATLAHERLVDGLQSGKVFHNGDPVLVQHISNARKRYNVHGLSFGKESRDSTRKVDAYAATVLAYEALTVYLDRGRKAEKPSRSGRVLMY